MVLAEVAYHEAGHAVLTLRCGRKLDCVWIGNGPDDGGNSRHHNPLWEKSDRGFLEIQGEDLCVHMAGLLIALAGVYAQRKFAGNQHIPIPDGDKSDVDNFFAGSSLSEGEIKRVTRQAKKDTQSLVAYYWPDIEAVATALLDRRKLAGSEVAELLDPKLEGVTINGVKLCP